MKILFINITKQQMTNLQRYMRDRSGVDMRPPASLDSDLRRDSLALVINNANKFSMTVERGAVQNWVATATIIDGYEAACKVVTNMKEMTRE